MSKETLRELINENIPDNTSRKIKPIDVREVLDEIVNEMTTVDLVTPTTDGLMSSEDKVKLDSLQENAEVNVQSDWNETDSTNDAFIVNKPDVPVTSILGDVDNIII